jgi:hypothetical protein
LMDSDTLEVQLKTVRSELLTAKEELVAREAPHYAALVQKQLVVETLRKEAQQLRDKMEGSEKELAAPRASLVTQASRLTVLVFAVAGLFATADGYASLSAGIALLSLTATVWGLRR